MELGSEKILARSPFAKTRVSKTRLSSKLWADLEFIAQFIKGDVVDAVAKASTQWLLQSFDLCAALGAGEDCRERADVCDPRCRPLAAQGSGAVIFQEFRISIDETTVGREFKALGFAKLLPPTLQAERPRGGHF